MERCNSDQLNTFHHWSELHLFEMTSYKIHTLGNMYLVDSISCSKWQNWKNFISYKLWEKRRFLLKYLRITNHGLRFFIRSHSITTWTWFYLVLTTYLPLRGKKLHFWTTYPPHLVHVVIERPMASLSYWSAMVSHWTTICVSSLCTFVNIVKDSLTQGRRNIKKIWILCPPRLE